MCQHAINGDKDVKKIALVLFGILSLTACKPGEDKATALAQKEMVEGLKDPDSAKFKNLRVTEIHGEQDGSVLATVCGQLNAKNSFNAYVGYKKFILTLAMKEKGFFSKGVTYSVISKNILQNELDETIFKYQETCGADE